MLTRDRYVIIRMATQSSAYDCLHTERLFLLVGSVQRYARVSPFCARAANAGPFVAVRALPLLRLLLQLGLLGVGGAVNVIRWFLPFFPPEASGGVGLVA